MMSDYPKTTRFRASIVLLPAKDRLSFYLLLSFFYLISLPVFGQIDSLEKQLVNLPENTQKVDALNELSYFYHNNDIAQTFAYANEALALTNRLNYTKGKAHAFHNLCIANSISGNSQLAMEFNDKVIQLADSIKAYELLINAYRAKGIIQNKASNPVLAIEFFQKSFDLAQQENYSSGIIMACFSLGNAYMELDKFEQARDYYQLALATAKSIKNKNDLGWGNRCMARTYYDEGNYVKAESFFKKALEIAREIKDKRSLAFALSDFANNHLKMGKNELAEQYLLESIQTIQSVGDNEGTVQGLRDLAKLYLETDRPNKTIEISNQALALNKKNNISNLQLNLLGFLSAAYAQKQDYKTAYEIIQLTQLKKDSLDYKSKLKLTAELEEKYQSKRKETENALLRAEQKQQAATIQQQKSFNFFLVTIACLLGLLGYIAFQAYRNKKRNNLILEEKVAERTQALQKTNKELLQSNEELARFAYVASHDLREPLRNITNFVHLLKRKIQTSNQEEETLQFIEIIDDNTTHMNNLIVDTLEFTQLSKIDNQEIIIDLNQTLQDIQANLAATITKANARIEISQRLPTILAIEGLPFSLFKNLIANGIKYNENAIPVIKINHTNKESFYIFTVQDNGIGIPKAYHKTIFELFKRLQNRGKYEGSGMGLANCKKIIDKLGGEIWVESDGQNGTTFFFTIPTVKQKTSIIPQQKKMIKKHALSI